jgi:hypothetical protein
VRQEPGFPDPPAAIQDQKLRCRALGQIVQQAQFHFTIHKFHIDLL